MSYYENRPNAINYIKMAEGYDGAVLIAVLKQHLAAGSTVLELGMGPGTDVDLLAQTYKVTGSDYAQSFLDIYRAAHPNADLLQLDAEAIDTERTFNCIYSNKVLHQLTKESLRASLARQHAVLTSGGLLMHSFWYGDESGEQSGIHYEYYTEETLLGLIGDRFEVVTSAHYAEMGAEDSFYILLRKLD
ncbi:MAG: class I SAM-dependent methyltransferase [Candidatus Promineifilaceae bacterium]